MTTMAIGWRKLASPPLRLSATGSMPHAIAIVVMTIGRARLWHASTSASKRWRPARRDMIAYSTSRMEFFVTTPISIRRPMTTGMEKLVPVNTSGIRAPPSDNGSAARIVKGWRKSWKSRTRTA